MTEDVPYDLRDLWQAIQPHLTELRNRLIISVVALVVTSAASFTLSKDLMSVLAIPIGGLQNLTAIEVTESFGVYMQVSLLAGLVFAIPIIFYELLAFILPALTHQEKRWVYIGIPFAAILFLGGVLFTYFIMLPAGIPFLTGFIADVKTQVRISNYMNFVTGLMFWLGVLFELPLVIFLLAKWRFVNAGMLLRYWRFAIVIIAIIAAVVTPTGDPFNMAIMMAPLLVLYALSIFLAYFAQPRPPKPAKPKKVRRRLRLPFLRRKPRA